MIRRLTVTAHPPDAISSRAINNACQTALEKNVSAWHGKYLKHHFEEYSNAKYPMHERTKKYNLRKQLIYGHKKFFVWSGRTREQALTSIQIKATKKRGQGTLNLPRYIYALRKRYDIVAELTSLSYDGTEASVLTTIFFNDMDKELKSLSSRYERRRL